MPHQAAATEQAAAGTGSGGRLFLLVANPAVLPAPVPASGRGLKKLPARFSAGFSL